MGTTGSRSADGGRGDDGGRNDDGARSDNCGRGDDDGRWYDGGSDGDRARDDDGDTSDVGGRGDDGGRGDRCRLRDGTASTNPSRMGAPAPPRAGVRAHPGARRPASARRRALLAVRVLPPPRRHTLRMAAGPCAACSGRAGAPLPLLLARRMQLPAAAVAMCHGF